MYLEKAIYENVGPIDKIDVDFHLNVDGNPKPIIFVGENGSGKSTVLSNIVDAFYEMAAKAYNDACYTENTGKHKFFKLVGPYQIKTNKKYMLTYIAFSSPEEINYICKSGDITTEEIKQHISKEKISIPASMESNYKNIFVEKENVENIWKSNVMCYFGPDRYERPSWMGDNYYQLEDYMHLKVEQKINGHLDKPISVKNVTTTNLQWLLDVITDSRADIAEQRGVFSIEHISTDNLRLLRQARTNLETILSTILGEKVYFALNYRNSGGSRFMIVRRQDGVVVCPTLDSLSTGQSALFNMFSTIVRYADINDINKSISLSDIQGIVVIDEIELHLHTKLQKEVLPRLLKLFPKVQFIITSHAPLFLLGMKDTYGEDNFDIIELPEGIGINTERFSEFQRAYDYVKETEVYKKELKAIIASFQPNNKPIIVTEGSTDWKHLKAAYQHLKAKEQYKDIFENLEFDFYEYEPEGKDGDASTPQLNMGNSVLCHLCENMAKLHQPVKYIFIGDRDDKDTNKKLSVPDMNYKKWGNNVFSFILPVPETRKNTPQICIEHYYSDEEIKTEWEDPETGIKRRLFMGNEFDKRGIAYSIGRFCEKRNACGEKSIAIIEGSDDEKVTSISESNNINYALPKSKFAKFILEDKAPFNDFNFDNFIGVFAIIKEIIEKEELV